MSRLIVLTGGPGAGKTAILEVVRKAWGPSVTVLPEAASIVFGGGFPRRPGEMARRAAQRAIYHVQRELERLAIDDGAADWILCDRGTVDGAAYWPGDADAFWEDVGTTLGTELARYAAVVHLRTPDARHGYNHSNPVRSETAEEAAAIDDRIIRAWADHPCRELVASTDDFVAKLDATLSILRRFGLPERPIP